MPLGGAGLGGAGLSSRAGLGWAGLRSAPGLNLTPSAFADDGATFPWYAAGTFPPAIHISATNKTWFSWQAWARHEARCPRVTVYDHTLESWSDVYTVSLVGQETDDDHGVPALCVDNSGYVHCFHGPHKNPMQHAVTAAANDPSTWTDLTEISGEMTYPHPVPLGDDIFLFMRKDIPASTKMPLVLYIIRDLVSGVPTSTDSEVTLCDFGADTRFYLGYTSVRSGKIHLTATYSDYNDQFRRNVYHFVYDPADGSIANLAGTVTTAAASLPIDLTLANTSYRIVSQSDPEITRHAGVAWTSNGDMHIVYMDSANGTTFPLYHSYWNGSAWSTPELLGNAAGAQTNPALVALADDSLEVYYDEDAAAAYTRGGNIVRHVRTSDGVWGPQTRLHTAGANALCQTSVVLDGHADCRVIWSEIAASSLDSAAGDIPSFAWGAGGFLRRNDGIPLSDEELELVIDELASTVLTASQKTAYANFFVALRATSALAAIPAVWLGKAPTQEISLINLRSPSSVALLTGGVTFTAFDGWTTDGIDGLVDSQVVPSTAGFGAQNSYAIGFGCLQDGPFSGTPFGGSDGTRGSFIQPWNASNAAAYRINCGSSEAVAGTITDSEAIYIANRTGGTALTLQKDLTSIDTGNTASNGLPTQSIAIGRVASTFAAVHADFMFAAPSIAGSQGALANAVIRFREDIVL